MIKPILLIIFLLISFSLPAQTGSKKEKKITITGKITDVNNLPVEGATIVLDDKNTNRVTDKNGFFKVTVRPGAEILSILLNSETVFHTSVIGQREVNISIPVDIIPFYNEYYKAGEEEVNIGYGKVKRKNLLNPVSQVDGRSNKYASYQNIYEMLRGQPGVHVNGTSINIRGQTSFYGGTEPLLVVDGIVVSTIEDIHPRYVRYIEILKGPAAAIYGVRGANGVILITLNSGQDD